ncbi:MAG: RnfABCDGE type electron transport complex subunit B [Ectothiorhodospira sp.]
MYAAIFVLTAMGLSLGYALGMAGRYLRVEEDPLAGEIEALLPGTNCGQCGLPGCGAAAQALAEGQAKVTLCPPGGQDLARQLAEKLDVEADLSTMEEEDTGPVFARIDPEQCNGCTRCFKICPTDAIVGANRQMHAVFPEACNGCGQCVAVCPMDGITLESPAPSLQRWRWPLPEPR